jgi:tetratricopeptide (TPR) repeat protein
MLDKAISNKERLAGAKALELDGETDEAIEAYQRVLRNDPLNETAIGRLLVLHRREKAYKQELAVLKAAISAYEAEQLSSQEAWRKKHQKAARISLSLARKLAGDGSAKKGAMIYDDRLVTTWRKRKAVVMKRLKG